MIRLEHVSKTFQTKTKEVHAVKDVSLEIEQGEILVLSVSLVPENRRWFVVLTYSNDLNLVPYI